LASTITAKNAITARTVRKTTMARIYSHSGGGFRGGGFRLSSREGQAVDPLHHDLVAHVEGARVGPGGSPEGPLHEHVTDRVDPRADDRTLAKQLLRPRVHLAVAGLHRFADHPGKEPPEERGGED